MPESFTPWGVFACVSPNPPGMPVESVTDPVKTATRFTGVNKILTRLVPSVPAPLTGAHHESMFSVAHDGLICTEAEPETRARIGVRPGGRDIAVSHESASWRRSGGRYKVSNGRGGERAQGKTDQEPRRMPRCLVGRWCRGEAGHKKPPAGCLSPEGASAHAPPESSPPQTARLRAGRRLHCSAPLTQGCCLTDRPTRKPENFILTTDLYIYYQVKFCQEKITFL
jgi:hypothetical protein